jgi:hypothetical protein
MSSTHLHNGKLGNVAMISVRQSTESSNAKIQAWIVDSLAHKRKYLVPGKWVDLGVPNAETCRLNVIVLLPNGYQQVIFDLKGATRNGEIFIRDEFKADRDVNSYFLSVTST